MLSVLEGVVCSEFHFRLSTPMGLWVSTLPYDPPWYTSNSYQSMTCKPTQYNISKLWYSPVNLAQNWGIMWTNYSQATFWIYGTYRSQLPPKKSPKQFDTGKPIFWPRPYTSVGILTAKMENPVFILLWQMRALFLCFLGWGIDCNQ